MFTNKNKKLNIRKKGSVPNNYLEVIESDTQGPFPIIAADGTRNNVKFVDKKSRYTKMFTIPNREASTILNYFIQFKSRMENITGKNIKNIRTDQGTEYKGEFLEYLTQNGIIKQTGIAYEHTHPGQAERVHQTIMTMGREMLRESKLPAKFYNEGQLTAFIYTIVKFMEMTQKHHLSTFTEKDQIFLTYDLLVVFAIHIYQLKEDQNWTTQQKNVD